MSKGVITETAKGKIYILIFLKGYQGYQGIIYFSYLVLFTCIEGKSK